MAYNGTTKVLSGLIPANGTAPVADVKDIYVNDSTRLDQKLSNMDAAIGEGSGNKLNSAAVAPTYSASTPYSVGNLVTHEGGFYRCNTAIATPGEEWNSAHWDVVNAQGVFMTEAAAEAAFVQKETGKSLMTDAERTKLAGIAAGATAVTVDSALTQGGTNPVQGGAIHTALATIQNMVGSPLVAATAADMTDNTRIYVYTGNETGYTNGNWYYYDGSNWASGGVYNSTALTTDTTLAIPGAAADAKAVGDAVNNITIEVDATLTEQGKAADAKAVGDEVDNLKSALNDVESAFITTNEFNRINNHIVTGALIQLATSKWVVNADYRVLIANVSPGDRIGIIAGSTNATYYAFLTDDNVVIGETAPFAGDYTVPATLNASANAAITAPNNAKYLYITLGTLSANRTPANLTNNGLDILATIPANIEAIETKTVNYVASLHQGARFAYNATRENKYFPFVIKAGHTYKMVSAGINVNVRYMDEMGGNRYILATNVGGQNPIKYAVAEHDGAVIYFGSNSGAIDITIIDVTYENINIIVDPNGNGDFKTLREGVAYAITRPHSKVYVNPGTYDLLTEFAFEIAAAGNTQYGICLENDVHIVFSSGALVTALYTGNVQNVTTYFAPFYVGTNGGGFTLENLTIKASNTRYCVHDEYNGANVRTNNKYINCRFEFDNTTAPIDYYPQCIGGGVAKHSYVEIVGCYFKSKRAESQKTPLVSYHNASDAYVDDALSYINIRDCYFADTYGMFRFTSNGSYSEPVSVAYLQGNSFGMTPEVAATGSATVVNVSILEWGNIVRT